MNVINYKSNNQNSNVALSILVLVGTQHENQNNNGISHLLEHLIVQSFNTEHSWVQPYYLDTLNGYTFKNRTSYTTEFSKEDSAAVENVIDKIFNFKMPSKEMFEIEKKVILEELLEDEEDEYYRNRLKTEIWFYGDSSLRLPILGTKESIKNISYDAVWKHYQKFYSTDNAVISLIGDDNIDVKNTNKTSKLEVIHSNIPNIYLADNDNQLRINNDKKDQVSYGENWVVETASFEEVVTVEFITSLLNDYLHTFFRKKGYSYSLEVNAYTFMPYTEIQLYTLFEKNKLKKVQDGITDLLSNVRNKILKNDFNQYKKEYINQLSLDNSNNLIFAENLCWYKAFCDEEFSVAKVFKIIQEIDIEMLISKLNDYGLSSHGVININGDCKPQEITRINSNS